MNDTYWIARAIWTDGQNGDEGFLIYADHTHYLFLDDAEAHTASVLIGALQPRLRQTSAHWRRAHRNVSGYLQRLRALAFLQTRAPGGLASFPLFLLTLPRLVCVALTLLTFVLCLGLHTLLLPAPAPGILLVLPIALASWCFGWSGSLWMAGSVALSAGASAFLQPGHPSWSLAWLLSFVPGSLGGLLVGLFIAALRQVTDHLLAQFVQHEQNRQADQQEPPPRTSQPLLSLEHEADALLTSFKGLPEEQEACAGSILAERLVWEKENEQPGAGRSFAFTLSSFPARKPGSPGQMEALASD